MSKNIVRAAVALGLATGLLPLLDVVAFANDRISPNHSEPGRS